jgi:GT2 family glycosyltransferase
VQHSFSIIIVTWNALEHLKRFIPSVAATDYSDFEIIIANNASEDSTADWIKTNYPECKVITYDRNYGYAAGNNRAVKYASGEILVFLNNDVKTEPDWLNALDKVFRDSSVGIAQPKLRSVSEPNHFEYAGAAGGYIDWMGYPFCRGRLMDKVEKDKGQYDETSEIFWASGAAFAIRKELFKKVGGFDEDFEFHMEEIDLCWRCLKVGHKIKYVSNSTVFHLGGGSLAHGSARKVFYNYRNNLLMLLKNLDQFIIPKIFFRLILDGISGVRSLLKGKPAETWAIIRAHFSFYGMIPTSDEIDQQSNPQKPGIEATFNR